MLSQRSYIHGKVCNTERCPYADGANVSSVQPISIITSLNSEVPGLQNQILYFFQFAFTYTYKCLQRRSCICLRLHRARGEGTAWSLPAGGAQTTKLGAARSNSECIRQRAPFTLHSTRQASRTPGTGH